MKDILKEKKVIKISIVWFFVAIIIIASIVASFKNYIFATNEKPVETVPAFEKNQKAVDVIQVMFDNTNSSKKLVNEKREVQYETIYEENPNLPKDEKQTKQEGKTGSIQVTAIQDYKDEKLECEEIIESTILEDKIDEIIYIGTSEFLSRYSVHIGDNMYLLESEELKEQADENSNNIEKISRYLNVSLIEAGEDWIKVGFNGKEGYIKTTNITSETVTPIITEKNRIARLKANLNIDMDLSTPSGLTLSDFKTALTNNNLDKNKIFENNAQTFYNVEQKYKINGIFLAAIGIHESGWGTSSIATIKYNLFGYTAYDSDPFNSATAFENYANSIEKVAEALSINYLHVAGTQIGEGLIAKGTYFNGTTVKSVNIRYASDTNWADKVYSYMEYLYNKL